ncbi:MAG: peptidylprolyl isomerase [Ignavibacteria bacterium]|jgi:hypothetical protein
MNLKKLLSNPGSCLVLFISAIVLFGCKDEPKRTGFIARVDDSYLSAEELNDLVDTNSATALHKNEVIRNWINSEILFKEATKEGILEEHEYKALIEESKRDLAGSILLNKYSSSKIINVEQKELLNYYESHRNDFKLIQDSYLLNIIYFNNRDRAIEFRALLLDSDWEKSMNVFYNDSTIIKSDHKIFLRESDIYSEMVLRIVKRLHPLEISIVISESEGYYTVVQVLAKYLKDSIPEFEIIKQSVKERYIAEKRKELIETYIKNLYSDYQIEVKN